MLVTTLATFSWLLIPSVRMILRRRVNRVIDDVNTRLQIELRPFQLTRRQTLIDRLVYDPEVVQTLNEEAHRSGDTREALAARVAHYARNRSGL